MYSQFFVAIPGIDVLRPKAPLEYRIKEVTWVPLPAHVERPKGFCTCAPFVVPEPPSFTLDENGYRIWLELLSNWGVRVSVI